MPNQPAAYAAFLIALGFLVGVLFTSILLAPTFRKDDKR